MTTRTIRTNRVRFFSNAIFALTIAVLLIQLEPRRAWTGEALIPSWPTALSYAISYLLVAIGWVNHRYSLNYASITSSRLIWVNFSHMFAISLIPFATTWISHRSRGDPCFTLRMCPRICERDLPTPVRGYRQSSKRRYSRTADHAAPLACNAHELFIFGQSRGRVSDRRNGADLPLFNHLPPT